MYIFRQIRARSLPACAVVVLLAFTVSTAQEASEVERVKLDLEGAPSVGPDTAPVTLVMFHDYECQYSAQARPTVAQLRRTYGERLRVVYRQNPYRGRRNAFYAAQAALAARDFDLFEALHGKLVQDREKLEPEDVARYVGEIGGNPEDFETALDSGAFVDMVRRDKQMAQNIGATGTPFFFVNGRPIRGARSFEVFSGVIEEELVGTAAPTRWIRRVARPVYSDDENESGSAGAQRRPGSESPAPLDIPPLPSSATAMEKLLYEQIVALRREVAQLKREIARLRGGDGGRHGLEARDPKPGKSKSRPQPPPVVASVSLDDDPVMGASSARVAIVEFSQYRCGFCRRFHEQTFPRIRSKYIDSGRVRYVFRDFASGAAVAPAVAANCAGLQERYWEMQSYLFKNSRRLGESVYAEAAGELELDREAFEICLTDRSHAAEISADRVAGQDLMVRGTPTFFVGRIDGERIVQARRVVGARKFQDFERVIDEVLKEVERR